MKMNQYKIIRANDLSLRDGSVWEKAPSAKINIYPWGVTYRPQAEAQLVYTESAFILSLKAIEPASYMRTEARGISPTVYQDSCMELFFMPTPAEDRRYVNLEFNAAGALYIGIGTGRENNRLLIEQDIFVFNIQPFLSETKNGDSCWGVSAEIPFSFLEEQFGFIDFHPGHQMLGNFYKCGDLTPSPHFGVWNPINLSKPDFHRPEYFGELVLC